MKPTNRDEILASLSVKELRTIAHLGVAVVALQGPILRGARSLKQKGLTEIQGGEPWYRLTDAGCELLKDALALLRTLERLTNG
jgi:predicted transcriptional regulator